MSITAAGVQVSRPGSSGDSFTFSDLDQPLAHPHIVSVNEWPTVAGTNAARTAQHGGYARASGRERADLLGDVNETLDERLLVLRMPGQGRDCWRDVVHGHEGDAGPAERLLRP